MKTEKSEGQPWRMIIWILLCVGIVSGGLAIAVVLIKLGPKAPKVAPEVVLSSVRVVQVEQGDIQVEVVAQGNVEAERATQLVAQVGGRVIAVSPRLEAGEIFKKHETLLKIDPTDYQAALANAQASLEDAKLAKAVEKASAEKAIRDWEKLGNGRAPSDLVLRKPQLASAEARVVAAQAGVDKALADLDRAQVVAPYDCRIEVKHLDEGATLAPGSPIANVISVGAVEVRLPLSLEDYGFLERSDDGVFSGKVTATGRVGGEVLSWEGSVLRSEEFVEQTTRSINVVVRFDAGGAPLPGLFVNARIKGRVLADRILLPREALIDSHTVLLVTADDTLIFRDVVVERTEFDTVIVKSGLKSGDRVCLTPLSTPVEGMKVEVEEPSSEPKSNPEPKN